MWWVLNTPGGNFFFQMDKQEKKYKKYSSAILILKSSRRYVKMLCSLLLYKELPQEVCWQCLRIYAVTLSTILTLWTQQGTSRSGWSSSCKAGTAFLRSVRFLTIPGTESVFITVPLVSIHVDGCISQEGIRLYSSGRSPGGGRATHCPRGQSSLAGYSPQGCTELDPAEVTQRSTSPSPRFTVAPSLSL